MGQIRAGFRSEPISRFTSSGGPPGGPTRFSSPRFRRTGFLRAGFPGGAVRFTPGISRPRLAIAGLGSCLFVNNLPHPLQFGIDLAFRPAQRLLGEVDRFCEKSAPLPDACAVGSFLQLDSLRLQEPAQMLEKLVSVDLAHNTFVDPSIPPPSQRAITGRARVCNPGRPQKDQ